MPFIYKPRTDKQLRSGYNRRAKLGLNGFDDFEDFLDWFNKQELVCHYCGLTEIESQEISMKGILTSNRFPKNGAVMRGKNRAVWLEIDRYSSEKLYSRDNCVICCYFCNNDKSDVFSGDDYIKFHQNRLAFLKQILNLGNNFLTLNSQSKL